jgi:hypothetical protein
MAEDYVEGVGPADRVPELDLRHRERRDEPEVPERAIRGHVIAINRGHPHTGEKHRLDVTVGGGEHTEIIVRLPPGAYAELEGADVLIRRAR